MLIRFGRLTLLALLLALDVSAEALGQTEAPSDFQRQMDSPPPAMDEEFSTDAVEAQAEATATGEATPGLSRTGQVLVEEIVVQARKRTELLEETPVAVTVLDEQLLRQAGVFRLDQIQDLVPNMAIQTGIDGMNPVIRIRGVGTSTFEAAFDPGVGVYVDGVFLSRSMGTLLDTVDVAQIEVLRGPQGTLFGKNTVGGAISIVTAKPHEDLEAFVMLRPGNYGSLVARAMVNLPIWEDKVLSRFAISSKSSDGYVDNVLQDTGVSRLGSMGFLGSLRFQLIDDLTIDWTGQYASDQTNGRGGECVFVRPGPLNGLAPSARPACESLSGPFKSNADVSQLNRLTSTGTWGVIQYDVGDLWSLEEISLKSLTSWRHQHAGRRFDVDQSPFPLLQVSNVGGGLPTDGIPADQDQIQQELQLNASAWDGRISFVTGFFSFWENSMEGRALFADAEFTVTTTGNRIETDNFTWALFGQGTVDATEWLSLTAGLRYTSDRKSFTQSAWDIGSSAPPLGSSAEDTFTSWTPTATLSLTTPQEWLMETPVEHLMGYFTYSRGFKGGGFNAIFQSQVGSVDPTPFQPETLDSYELGFKSIAFEGRVTTNLALFYADYDDIQVTQFLTSFDPDNPEDITSQRMTRNAAKATTKGVELEVFLRPYDGLLINGTLGYVDARFDDFPDAENQITGEVVNRAGETFDRVPEFNSFLSVQYSIPIEMADTSSMSGWLTPRLEWIYRSGYHLLSPEIQAGAQSGYNLLNARLSYDFWDDRAQVAIWAKNLLDKAYMSEAFAAVSTFGFVSRFYDPPLTFGGELSYRF